MRILNLLFFSFCFLMLFSCVNQDNQKYISEISGWQDTMNLEFSHAQTSPLDSVDLLNFKGLDFYPIDQKYRVEANFVATPNEQPFFMKTTTDRLPVYRKFGYATFSVDGKNYKLFVYQNQDLIKKPGFEKYLFIPFMDKTTGIDTYKGGRYIDLLIPDSTVLIIDFNKAYNPYCAYNQKYSCPIPPYENQLDLFVYAGVKNFKH